VLKYIDEFRDVHLVNALADKIRKISVLPVSLMEVCGGHTMAIHRNGLNQLLPPSIRLLSGPGCPVCVSGQRFIDHAIQISRIKGVAVATFGDLMRVPGSAYTLEREKRNGADIRIVYSVREALDMAIKDKKTPVVFLGIGFETTAPATAAAILMAREKSVDNFFVLSAHKQMPQALEILASGETRIDGFIAPGHVSAITGFDIYSRLTREFRKPVVISGFEPSDILQTVLMLILQIQEGRAEVENQYQRVVRREGNRQALGIMERVFQPVDADWRGLGIVPDSGLGLRSEFERFDAEKQFVVRVKENPAPSGCICGEILTGKKSPEECNLFGTGCTPVHPVGACMVSSEGVCAIHYRYR